MAAQTTRPALLLLSLALALAGCSEAPPAEGAPTAFEGIEYEATQGTLRGVVVDAAIIPIAGAQVAIQGIEPITTNELGAFVATGLEPAVYVVEVTKIGYYPVTTTASVDGGDDPPTIKVILDRNEAAIPYASTMTQSGFLECGAGLGVSTWSICQVPIAATELACDVTGVCTGPINNHRGQLEFNVDGVPTFTQGEMVWTPSQPAAQSLTLGGFSRHPDTIEFNNGTSVSGPSPLAVSWDAQANINNQIGAEQDLIFQVYPSREAGSVVLEQELDIFVTTFYNYAPPEGWLFVVDGELAAPQ